MDASKWAEFAEATVDSTMYAFFQTQLKGIVRGDGNQHLDEDEEGDLERRRRLKDEEKQSETMARRLAIHNMMTTEWDFKQAGIGIEIAGDSLVVIRWLTGQWEAENYAYRKRVYNIINILSSLAEVYRVRAAANGRDIFKHEFREFNQKADRLTHEAREGHPHEQYKHIKLDTYNVWKPIAIRGNFDGGKSATGTACGAFLDMAFIPRESADPYRHVVWIEVWERAWLLEPHQTVTDAEMTAAECMVHTIPGLIDKYFL